MNVRRIALLVAPCVLAAGCRQDPYLNAHIEMVNAEKRSLEDRVYELQYDNQIKAEELEKLRKESPGVQPRRGDTSGREVIEEPGLSPPKVEIPGETTQRPYEENPQTLKPPEVEPGVPVEPSTEPSPASTYPAAAPGSPETPEASSGETQALLPSDTRIVRIDLHPTLTCGRDWDDQPGDDGLTVVIEPRNASRTCVPLPGAVTVAVTDMAETEEEQIRVARWDLDAREVARHVRNSPEARGIYLDLPWPGSPPRHSRLSLSVRYVTADGRRLEIVNREIVINPPGELSHRWAPRSSPPAAEAKEKTPDSVARPQWSPYR